MAAFVDKLGREWVVSLTAGDLRRVREETGVELGKLLTDAEKLADILFGDPEKLGQVLWVLIAAQAGEKHIDADSFADGFDRETVEASAQAVTEAVADFYQPRPLAGRTKKALRQAVTRAEAAMAAKLDELTTSNASVGNSPGSPASTPNGGPSAS